MTIRQILVAGLTLGAALAIAAHRLPRPVVAEKPLALFKQKPAKARTVARKPPMNCLIHEDKQCLLPDQRPT